VHHGNLIQIVAKSRIAQVAALLAILGSLATVLQYTGTFAANVQLRYPMLRFVYSPSERGDPQQSFLFRFENMGPDNIKDLEWQASIVGPGVDISDVVRGTIPLVAKGDVYYVKNLTSDDILKKLSFEKIRETTEARVCMTFSGNVFGVKQWILLEAKGPKGSYAMGTITDLLGLSLKIASAGSRLALGRISCG
jgi:hypothetical protein